MKSSIDIRAVRARTGLSLCHQESSEGYVFSTSKFTNILNQFIFNSEITLLQQIQAILNNDKTKLNFRQLICDHNERLSSRSDINM
jgi:hypothetical protein